MSGGFLDASAVGLQAEQVDYVVVGSGAGGGAAARTLADAGASVVVLEEGPYVPEGQTRLFRDAAPVLFRNQGKQAAFGRATTPILQGCCVGGTTFINSAIIWRLPEKIWKAWDQNFGLGEALSHEALEKAYVQLEADMKVRPVAEGLTSNRQDLLLRQGAVKVGLEGRFLHRSEDGCQGTARCLFGCPHRAKQSTTVNYLRRATEKGCQVFAHARVERLVFEGGRAVGVRGRVAGKGAHAGEPFTVRAKKAVIVAASVVQSSNLLRRSGLKNPELGEHFMAHPGTSVMAVFPDPVNMWSGASQGYEVLGLRDTLGIKLESINVPPEVVAARLPGAGARFMGALDKLGRLAATAVAIRADAQGTIRPSWLFGDKINYELTTGDLERARMGVKRVAEIHFEAGAQEVYLGIAGIPEVVTSIDQLRCLDNASTDPRAYTMIATHLFGGCIAGKDPRKSVVDPNLKVHGVDGLYVMDASVFPTNTGVNPQHSIMAIATVAATRLVA
jgi:choline dehydrogenase-like flavoprotein